MTRAELDAHGFVNDRQRYTALFDDDSGNECVCGKLYSSHHPSQDLNDFVTEEVTALQTQRDVYTGRFNNDTRKKPLDERGNVNLFYNCF